MASLYSKSLPYSLGDMLTEKGESIWWRIEKLATELAVCLAEHLATLAPYKVLAGMLPPQKVALFFEVRVKLEIYPVLRDLFVMQWYIQNGLKVKRREIIWHNHQGLGPLLQAVWPDKEIPLVLGWSRSPAGMARECARRVRRDLHRMIGQLVHVFKTDSPSQIPTFDAPSISIHYVEGIDLSRRSELFWYPASHVNPARILLYFVSQEWSSRRRVPKAALRQIEEWGMKWVSLERGNVVERKNPPVWLPRALHPSLLSEFRESEEVVKSVCPIEKWVAKVSKLFLDDIEYWKSFYQTFNVKLHFEVNEYHYHTLAQNIALDFLDGIHVGKQRSEDLGWEQSQVGCHPNHVFFAWNPRGGIDLEKNRNRIASIIVSGHPNDATFQRNARASRALRARVVAKGARFVIALFDNAFCLDRIQFSNRMMQKFYTQFLEWVLLDEKVGLIVKSKRPAVLMELPEIHGLLSKAESTGRCLNLDDIVGRLPSDASQAADMSVGIGISSALIEAVIAGGRGVFYDPTGLRSLPFYEWGFEKFVFDDLDRLMLALKRYKFDPASQPGLGDHSLIIDQLDPFRDGRAGERVGTYIRWLLEAFDKECGREAAIQEANVKYAAKWGKDKVLCLGDRGAPIQAVSDLDVAHCP